MDIHLIVNNTTYTKLYYDKSTKLFLAKNNTGDVTLVPIKILKKICAGE